MKRSAIDIEFQGRGSSSSVYLPEEIILKILTPLPAKFIGRCRCLSKQWRSLLSDPKFIECHLSLNNRLRKALVFNPRSVFVVDFQDSVASATELRDLSVRMGYCCSCSGLVLTRNLSGRRYVLLNPTTLERKEFPQSPDTIDIGYHLIGIGCNKVVAMGNCRRDVFVYTFGRDTWKTLRFQNPILEQFVVSPIETEGIFCNGCIHWLGITPRSPYSFMIISFDLKEENFRVVATPIPRDPEVYVKTTMGVVGNGGSLCVVCEKQHQLYDQKYENRDQVVDVWVMKDEDGSWTKLQFHYHFRQKYSKSPLFLGNEEVMLIASPSEAVIINVKEKSSRNIVINQLPDSLQLRNCTLFEESLKSPCEIW